MVVCLEQGAHLHTAQLMPLSLTVSCFSKIQIGFTFLVPAHLGSPGQRAVKRVCVCACVRVCVCVPSGETTYTKAYLYDFVALKRDHLLVEVLYGEHDQVAVDAVKQTQKYVALLLRSVQQPALHHIITLSNTAATDRHSQFLVRGLTQTEEGRFALYGVSGFAHGKGDMSRGKSLRPLT